ncbi:pyridoxal phosphate-dependent decarboxylase family protein [Streptomyces violascens]|uniref:Aromatic-L-amino-acid decarboxylase n=1 Tax=Streptomyces violascens TaxID=67381 RepID=A0ABQ3QT61_9ACTN|nr:aminotransferase class I/II-fold pyridoxal phosphate-dependent enzyme [Streptomyces violascens]GHI40458.1 aromatic-L-amino-acid decarboxylase [Streptomyces violascens]
MTTTDGTPSVGDWTPQELEENGRLLLSCLRRHFEDLRTLPVTTDRSAQEIRGLIDEPLPTEPEAFGDILDQTWRDVRPHLTLWNHPRFHAYFSNSSSGPAILAEMATAALNVNVMLWDAAPAAAAVESTVLKWLADLLAYPEDGDAVLVDGASLATLYALAAAREQLTGLDVRQHGLAGSPRLRVYASDQTHSSIDKAAITLGIGLDNVIRLPTSGDGMLRPDALDAQIRADVDSGYRPMAVVANIGTTSTGAVDPLEQIAEVCAQHGVWLHADAAYGGFWRIADGVRPHVPDLSAADSLVANPHKVLLCPMEASALFCRHPDALTNTFRLVPEYLTTRHENGSVDFMNYSLQLGRQFRALKLWWIIKSFGVRGIAERLTAAVDLADRLRKAAGNSSHWKVENPDTPFPLVCLRYAPRGLTREQTDALNQRIHQRVNTAGRSYVSHTVVECGYVIRVSIGNIHTLAEDIDVLWRELSAAAAAEEGSAS